MQDPGLTVSVIIPVLNAERTLQRAIDSVLAQTCPVIEIIIVDNNSSDGSLRIAQTYATKYPQLIRLLSETKPGANPARIRGIKEAKGTWIQLLDADDELLPDKIRHQVAIIDRHSSADLICGEAIIYSGDSPDKEIIKKIRVNDDRIAGLIHSQLGSTCSNLWKRAVLLELDCWNPAYSSSQEYFTMLEIYKAGKNILSDKAVYTRIYAYPESISNTKTADRAFLILKNRLNYYDKLNSYLKENNQLPAGYKTETDRLMRIGCYAFMIRYGADCAEQLRLLKKQYKIGYNFHDLLITYCHQVYSMKVKNKNTWTKYLQFGWQAIRHSGRLVQAMRF